MPVTFAMTTLTRIVHCAHVAAYYRHRRKWALMHLYETLCAEN